MVVLLTHPLRARYATERQCRRALRGRIGERRAVGLSPFPSPTSAAFSGLFGRPMGRLLVRGVWLCREPDCHRGTRMSPCPRSPAASAYPRCSFLVRGRSPSVPLGTIRALRRAAGFEPPCSRPHPSSRWQSGSLRSPLAAARAPSSDPPGGVSSSGRLVGWLTPDGARRCIRLRRIFVDGSLAATRSPAATAIPPLYPSLAVAAHRAFGPPVAGPRPGAKPQNCKACGKDDPMLLSLCRWAGYPPPR